MDVIVQAYPNIFPPDRSEDAAKGPAGEGEGPADDAAEPADDYTTRWGWISLVDTVSETQRCSWDEVWRKPMIEALNTFAYAKDRNARREEEMEKYKKTH